MALPARFDPIPLLSWTNEYGPIPDDYVAVDIESTGIDVHRDLPLQVGWCVVKNRKAVLEADVLIDWTRVLTPTALSELGSRIESTRARMAEKGKAYPWTLGMLRERGLPPDKAVARLAGALGADPAVAAHYGFQFDYPMLGRLFSQVGRSFEPDLTRMYDTGLMMRACLIAVSPAWNEPLPQYVKRLNEARCFIKHSLEVCSDYFDLKATTGTQSRHLHAASYDSWLVHLILEQLRGMTRPRPADEVPF